MSSPTPTSSPNLLRQLEEVKLIATGGMSQIFRAKQKSLERFLVIKRMKEDLKHIPEMRTRFRREAKALASVLHQNVAHVYDFVETESEAYLLMEYIDGVDLSVVIEKVGHVPPTIAGIVLLGIAKGVGYLHAHNLIHRDIKPGNIRLTTRGEVKLMDFGIVLELENTSLTRPGTMVGSPSYLSPEQVLGDPITPRSDVFLLGICFYEMLTGMKPFKDGDGETVFAKIREADYVHVRTAQPSVPKALAAIVGRCLAREPEARYASTRDLVMDIERWLGPAQSSRPEEVLVRYLDAEALANVSLPVLETVERRVRPWQRSLRLAAAGLTALLVFFGGYWTGHRAPRSTEAPNVQYPPPISIKTPVGAKRHVKSLK